MAQEDIEMVLCRHLASSLNIPTFLVDAEGNLLFFNEAAESFIGVRFSEVDEMSAEVWSTVFAITDENGHLLQPEEMPLGIALAERIPAHRGFNAVGLDKFERYIETTCIPIINRAGQLLGAIALFWGLDDAE